MRNCLLLAGPATQPERLLVCLARHPEVTTVSDKHLSQRLYGAARASVRECRSAATDDRRVDLVSHGRAEGGAELMRLFGQVRAAAGAPVVILHDPDGPMFPFLEPPPVSLLVLVRSAESAAAVIGACGIERVVSAAREALTAFRTRVGGFGVPADRLLTVEEDRLDADPATGMAEVCRMLGVASDPATVAAMLSPLPDGVRLMGGE